MALISSTEEVEAGGSEVECHSPGTYRLRSEGGKSLLRPCLKAKTNKQQGKPNKNKTYLN